MRDVGVNLQIVRMREHDHFLVSHRGSLTCHTTCGRFCASHVVVFDNVRSSFPFEPFTTALVSSWVVLLGRIAHFPTRQRVEVTSLLKTQQAIVDRLFGASLNVRHRLLEERLVPQTALMTCLHLS
jgi:hypothetical protein